MMSLTDRNNTLNTKQRCKSKPSLPGQKTFLTAPTAHNPVTLVLPTAGRGNAVSNLKKAE